MVRRHWRRLRRIYRVTRDYGNLHDSPVDRIEELVGHLFASRELPAILFGIAISLSITAAYGPTPMAAAVAGWGAFLGGLAVYIVAQEVIYAYRAASREFGDDPPEIY